MENHHGGMLKLEIPTAAEEVGLAAGALPGRMAVGPDLLPAEFYEYCGAPHGIVAPLFTRMLEWGVIPKVLSRFLQYF